MGALEIEIIRDIHLVTLTEITCSNIIIYHYLGNYEAHIIIMICSSNILLLQFLYQSGIWLALVSYERISNCLNLFLAKYWIPLTQGFCTGEHMAYSVSISRWESFFAPEPVILMPMFIAVMLPGGLSYFSRINDPHNLSFHQKQRQ